VPLANGAKINVELTRAGQVVQTSHVDPPTDAWRVETTLKAADLAPGHYDLKAAVKDPAGVNSARDVPFDYPQSRRPWLLRKTNPWLDFRPLPGRWSTAASRTSVAALR